MKLASLVAAAACLLLPVAGHAGVIYEWRPLDGSPPQDITLRLEFTQATVDGGAFSFSLPHFDAAPSYPDSGLVSLYYAFPGLGEVMDYRPQEQQFRYGLGALDMNLRFEAGGYLSGWIRANDQNSHFVLQSTGKLFTVLDANSDEGMAGAGCDRTTLLACSGATGYLAALAQNETAGLGHAVPEPHNIALLGLGALGLFGARRRFG